eukprot:TRINITY_DN19385_c0_g2_i2.p2 TRINITY_DN19385_c0_g2~~TRINITY_DN19385_c0_g2_i2.p2  ORF type:complete len:196 (-),score=47.02 TRINITY_DN19385_c0_g2_i2:2-589(-)
MAAVLSDKSNMAAVEQADAKPENVTQPGPDFLRSFKLVVAVAPDGGIGKDNQLPWRVPGDLKYFKHVTSSTADASKTNAVIMGRKTWESIPEKFRPLPNRVNIVLSRNPEAAFEQAHASSSLPAALSMLNAPEFEHVEGVFVIGGSSVYAEALASPLCSELLITRILTPFECDTCLLYTSPSPRDRTRSRMPSSA